MSYINTSTSHVMSNTGLDFFLQDNFFNFRKPKQDTVVHILFYFILKLIQQTHDSMAMGQVQLMN